LLLVIRDAARGFMMPDDFDAPVGRVRRERLQVEIRISLGETEHVAVRIPVTVPADIPALDQYAADAVFGRKVDVLLRLLRRCSVRRARAPGVPADVHAPPDANVLPRLYPGYVAELVRLVQVQDQVGVQQTDGVRRNLDRPPRGPERCFRPDPDTVRPWCQVRLEHAVTLLVEHEGSV